MLVCAVHSCDSRVLVVWRTLFHLLGSATSAALTRGVCSSTALQSTVSGARVLAARRLKLRCFRTVMARARSHPHYQDWVSSRRCAVLPPRSTSGSRFMRCNRISQESSRCFRIFLSLKSCHDLSAIPFKNEGSLTQPSKSVQKRSDPKNPS